MLGGNICVIARFAEADYSLKTKSSNELSYLQLQLYDIEMLDVK